jgi:hypothetical protein
MVEPMKNLEQVRAALPPELVLLYDVMPLFGLNDIYEANKMARAGGLPVAFFQLRHSSHAPWVATKKDWLAYIQKRGRVA